MPLYEYECLTCHRHTENRQKFSDPEITACPHCGGPLERVISAPAIAFRGSGWFKDGYGNAKPASSSENTGDAKSGDAKSGEAKPATDGANNSSESTGKPASGETTASPAGPAPSTASSTPGPSVSPNTSKATKE